jgi:hypothetical protein
MLRWLKSLSAELRARTVRNWSARCLTCGHRFPYPGIRVGAYGKPCKLMPCPRCQRWRCCRVEPVGAGGDDGRPPIDAT